MSRRYRDVTHGENLKNSTCHISNANNIILLAKKLVIDTFVRFLTRGDRKYLTGPVHFDFRIL